MNLSYLTNFNSKSVFILVLFRVLIVQGGFTDYINGISNFFGYQRSPKDATGVYSSEFMQKIPYEVSAVDEKFISEAVKLTGVAISELDSCQQRVVLKLKTDCHKMNDEQLAKMAVQLLNCQSYVEGRKIYPCSDEMSIKDCTTDMDSDTWTSYHLMSNRARAVCYMIRQTQFRGLAENTVNRLMEAAKDQVNYLGRIAVNQENILNTADNIYDSLSKAHVELSEQQKDMQKAHFHGQLVLENNIMRLVDEKRLIHETHDKLIQMTRDVQNKLENSAQMIEEQSSETKLNHKELLEDMYIIQTRADELFKKIEDYSQILFNQNQEFQRQYESTLKNLQEVNKTVHTLVTLVGGTRQALEERLSWIMTVLGGTDQAVDRLYLVLWHVGFMLTAMLACAFLSARASTRLIVASLPPLNLTVALYGREYLDFVTLCGVIGGFIAGQSLIIFAASFSKSNPLAILWSKTKTKPIEAEKSLNPPNPTPFQKTNNDKNVSYYRADSSRFDDQDHEETDDFNDEFGSPTPPVSRNGHYSSIRSRSRSHTPLFLNSSLKVSCQAKTRAGTPCKLTSAPGRDYCYKHQSGGSVMG